MKPEKSPLIKVINYIFSGMLFLMFLVGVASEMDSDQIIYSGLVISSGFLVLSAYLIWSTVKRYYGGFQTVVGIVVLTFMLFGITGDIQDSENIDGVLVSIYVVGLSIGISFLYWGKIRHENV